MPGEIGPGDFVKALRAGQRLWFLVERIEGRRIVGTLVNDPVTQLDGALLPVQPALRRGDLIWIRREEVMDVWKKETADANQ